LCCLAPRCANTCQPGADPLTLVRCDLSRADLGRMDLGGWQFRGARAGAVISHAQAERILVELANVVVTH
jgi:hypothetical protein